MADANSGQPADSSIITDAASAKDVRTAYNFCIDPPMTALIDDMSGTNLTLTPPSCGTKGFWYISLWDSGAGSAGILSNPLGEVFDMYACGSVCRSLYSPLPAGFPGPIATGYDAGASSPQAMCVSGQTGASNLSGVGMLLQLADNVRPPRSLIDASEYDGIEFWLWVSPETATSATASFSVLLVDRNQIPNGGVCDPKNDELTACSGANAAIQSPANVQSTFAGPFFDDNGREVTTLSGGWLHVHAPWSSFHTNPGWGRLNEDSVDPSALAGVNFLIQKFTSDGPGIVFDYCVYQLGFLPKPGVPALDGGAIDAEGSTDS